MPYADTRYVDIYYAADAFAAMPMPRYFHIRCRATPLIAFSLRCFTLILRYDVITFMPPFAAADISPRHAVTLPPLRPARATLLLPVEPDTLIADVDAVFLAYADARYECCVFYAKRTCQSAMLSCCYAGAPVLPQAARARR